MNCSQVNWQSSEERGQRGPNCYAATQASKKVKKLGQATHKDVLQNKNCSNVNIVNMWPQKSSLSDEHDVQV